MSKKEKICLSREDVVKLWLHLQHLLLPRSTLSFSKKSILTFLESVGGIQMDSVNVLDRAHYLTLWSRFGKYDKGLLDTWIYEDKLAYEYWGHESSLLPYSQLPHSKRRMRNFPPPTWENSAWWSRYKTSDSSKRRVLRRLKIDGALESLNFEKRKTDKTTPIVTSYSETLFNSKEDKRSLLLLWHAGKTAIANRTHFRRHYDLSKRIYPDSPTSTTKAYEESWLINGLRGNGVVSLAHLNNYFTAPKLNIQKKREIIKRFVNNKKTLAIKVEGLKDDFYVMPEHLDLINQLPKPHGTNIICPFDSFLWQRKRALELLNYAYKIEIYVPPTKRIYGYYLMPILHDGQLVGRLDPKFHRERGELEIVSRYLEKGFDASKTINKEIITSIENLADFVGAKTISYKGGWK